MPQYHLISIESDIVEDSYEDGEGKSTGCGLSGEKVGKSFPTLEALAKYCHDYHGLPENFADYEREGDTLCTTKQVADHSQAQNGGWMEPTAAEVEKWQKGELMLYSEHFIVKFLEH